MLVIVCILLSLGYAAVYGMQAVEDVFAPDQREVCVLDDGRCTRLSSRCEVEVLSPHCALEILRGVPVVPAAHTIVAFSIHIKASRSRALVRVELHPCSLATCMRALMLTMVLSVQPALHGELTFVDLASGCEGVAFGRPPTVHQKAVNRYLFAL